MAILEWRNSGEHNVHLHKKFITRVISTQVLDLADGGGKAHGEVEQQVSFIRLGRESSQIADMLGGGATPDKYHNKGEEETAGSVKPPDSAIEANYRGWRKFTLEIQKPSAGEERYNRLTQWEQNGADIKDNVSDCIVGSVKGVGQIYMVHK